MRAWGDEARQGVKDHGKSRVTVSVAVYMESATPHEVRLVNATLAERFVKKFPYASSVTMPTTPTGWTRSWD